MKRLCLLLLGWALALSVLAQVTPLKKFKFSAEENARILSVSVNSKRLIVGGDKGTLSVFEVSSGDSWQLPAHPAKIIVLANSFDNRFIASSSEDGTVSIYDFQESKMLKLNGATGVVKALTFSPTGRTLATANEDGKISIWDITSREKISSVQGRSEKVVALAFSPDGKILASGSADHYVMLWDVEKAISINSLIGHKDWVRAVAFSADGKTLASGSYDKTIKIWDVASGKLKQTWEAHKNWVTDVRFSPDGQYLVSSGADGQAIVWSADGKIIQHLKDLHSLVCTTQFSFDGKFLAAADMSNTISLYNSTALNIQPWKPFDVIPPSVVVLSPRLVSTKDATTGYKKSVVHQPTVHVLLEVTDLSGVTEVSIDGRLLEPVVGSPDRYQLDASYPVNSEKTLAIKAVDKSGNVTDDKLIIEHRRFSGSVDSDKYHAILIGIQEYKDPAITDLDQPVKDIHRLHDMLVNSYSFKEENVIVLENADRNSLYAKFDELQARLGKIDNLLIFYAGHGYWDEQLQQGYWLPSDAEPNKRSSWLSNGTLRDYIGGIASRHTLLITDACFSGGIFKTRAVFENASTAIETLYLRKSRKAMTSGTLEKVPDKSVFVDFLVRRLEENPEPYITAEEIFSGLRKAVINSSPNNQVPQYGEIGQTGDEGGEFIFIRKGN